MGLSLIYNLFCNFNLSMRDYKLNDKGMKMKIEKIEVVHLKLPLNETFEISTGSITEKDCLIIKLHADDYIGIGESSPTPSPYYYSYETPYTCIHIMKDFIIPRLLKRDIKKIGDVDDIFDNMRGNNFAKVGLETALWDLFAKYSGKSLYEFIGGENKEIPWKMSIGIKPSIRELLDTIERFLDSGCRSIKIKIKRGWDIEPVREIRGKFGDIDLSVDANSFYVLEDIEIFRELDKYDLTQIEQPLHYEDLYDHHILQSKINTPICLDESIDSVTTCKNALDIGSCKIVNIKIQRVGGLKNAILIHDMCKKKEIPVWVGFIPESGVGDIIGLALCSLSNVLCPSDISPTGAYFKEDIIIPDITMGKSGNIKLPEGIGLGCSLDNDKVDKFKVSSFEFK